MNALNSELDGHLLVAFLALGMLIWLLAMKYTRTQRHNFEHFFWISTSVSSARDPPTYYAGLARKTVKESPKDFTHLVVERCEVGEMI